MRPRCRACSQSLTPCTTARLGTSVAFHLTSAKSAGLFARVILESPGLTQSKPWEAATGNTQAAVSVLTAAGSPGCSWGTSQTTLGHAASAATAQAASWATYPGLSVISGHVLGVCMGTVDAAKAKCAARDDCFLMLNRNATAVWEL